MKQETGMRKDARIIVIDEAPAEIDPFMQPERELIGDISATLDLLTGSLELNKCQKMQKNI